MKMHPPVSVGAQSLDRYAAHWQRQRAAQANANRRLAEQARADLSRIVVALTERYPIRRIVLFGSLASGEFAPGSDIDLALEGLPRADYFDALAGANRLTRFWVDLKPIEDLMPRFRLRVQTTGQCLYEAALGAGTD